MQLFPSGIRYPIEFSLLALLILFLPSYEAPKNIFLVLYVVAWIVNRVRDRDFGGKWRLWDTLILVWIASGYIVAAFAGVHYHEWLGANDILRYGVVLWTVSRSHFRSREYMLLGGLTLIATLLALGGGFWALYVSHTRRALELHSVGHVNHSAIYLATVFGLSLAMSLAYSSTHLFWRWALWLTTLFLGLAILLSDSRAAVGVTVALTLALGVAWLRRSRRMLPWLTGLTALILIAAYLGQIQVVKKQTGLVAQNYVLAGRAQIWNVAKETWRQYPLFGVGLDNYSRISVEQNVRGWVSARGEPFDPRTYLGNAHAHSLYFNALAERGIFGVTILAIILFAWIAFLAKRVPQARASNVEWTLWGGAFSAWFVTVGVGFANTTLHHEHAILSVLLLALWLSYTRHHENDAADRTLGNHQQIP